MLETDATNLGCVLAVYHGVNSTNSPDSQPNTVSNNVSNLKLLYQQIGGVLVDNHVKSVMGFVVLADEAPTYNFSLTFSNSYFTQTVSIASYVQFPRPKHTYTWAPYVAVLSIYNLLVIAAMVWWCVKHKVKKAPL